MTKDELEILNKLMHDATVILQPHISEQDYTDVNFYIENGEFGVAWELLWYIALEDKLVIPPSLIDAGKIMNFDVRTET